MKISDFLKNIQFFDKDTSKESKIWTLLGIISGLFLIYLLIKRYSDVTALAFSAIPLIIVFSLMVVQYYRRIFYLLFISHFIILILARFIDNIPIGLITLAFNIFIIILLGFISLYRGTSWKAGYNKMLIIYSIWAIYCIIQLGNPNTVQEAWNIAITHYFVYPVICAILVPLTIRKTKNIEWLFILWGIFVFIMAAKGYWQKSHGFNEREEFFLFELGGATTHILSSGIRYFSFFTDATNFGIHMAMAVTGFSIAAYNAKSIALKLFYFFVVIAAIYGIAISGTRAAVAVPIAGALLFTIISKNKKAFFTGVFAIAIIFAFFRFTTLGNSVQEIRRMRSAFTPTTDASFQVRVYNREKIREYMVTKPFGYGLGLGGSKAEKFRPKEMIPLPPDSWFVTIWIETGIIGLILYIILHAILFFECAKTLMYKVKSIHLRNQLVAWLCVNAGFFVASYASDIMQYPNMIIIYTGFALCFTAPYISENDKTLKSIPDKS